MAIKNLSTAVLVEKLAELCSKTCNVMNTDLPKHYREVDEVKAELKSRIKD